MFKTCDKNSVFSPVELSTIKSIFSCFSSLIVSLITSTSSVSITPSPLASKRLPFNNFSSKFFWIIFSSIELASIKSLEASTNSFFSSSVLTLSEKPVSVFVDTTCSVSNKVFTLPSDEILIIPTLPKLSSAKLTAVSLAEDSFGNVGIINISSEGKVKTLFDTEQVVSTNTETGFSERVKTDDEKKELVDASNDLIEASSIDENIIQKNLEEKLLNGSLLDANGDGVIDTLDVEVIKETIKLEKQEKIDFIVDNSTGENTEFLSQVLNKSDEASIGDSINKIFEINNDLVASVITNLSNEDNTFLTTSNSEANNAIKEKIYTQMLSNSANVETIGKIISKSDGATIEKMINIVSLSDTNDPNSNLSLQVYL